MSDYVKLFRTSPFEPLREHMAKVMECVGFLKPMLETARDADAQRLEGLTKDVFRVEHEADIIKDEIRQSIPKTFFLPVYRGDLLGDLKLQDDMADCVEDVAVLLTIKNLPLPPAIAEGVLAYGDKVLEVCDKAVEVSNVLPKIIENGFSPDEVDKVIERIAAAEKAEWKADRAQYKLSQSLFALEDEMKPADLFLWFRVFAVMGELANAAEKTADRIRRMLSSH